MIDFKDKLKEVHDCWFGILSGPEMIPAHSNQWFQRSDAFDREIEERFSKLLRDASQTLFDNEGIDVRDQLALVILFDQFPRNMFRGTARAFAYDHLALEISQGVVSRAQDKQLFPIERTFLYLPFEHAENLTLQRQCEELFRKLVEEAPESVRDYFSDNLVYATRHREIIERFGRFPHRNAALGRASTGEELAFLQEPMSSF